MSKSRWISIACLVALLVGGAVVVSMPRTMEIAIPVLRDDGSMGATIVRIQRPGGFLASTLVRVRGIQNDVRLFAASETNAGQLLPFTQGPPDDVLLAFCDQTSILVSQVFTAPPGPGSANAWYYLYSGNYLASGPLEMAAADETSCVKDALNLNPNANIDQCFCVGPQGQIMPDCEGSWGGIADGFPFVDANAVFTVPTGQQKLFFASAAVPTAGSRTAQCKLSVCGNGILQGGEQCDDENTAAGDGCSSTCQTTTQCNDGVDNSDPEDTLIDCADPGCHSDGNASNPTSCVSGDNDEGNSASCGNGVTDPGEQCDDGNSFNTDACVGTCRNATCGDTFVRAGVEQCDDGNTVAGDGCSSTCQTTTQCSDGVDNADPEDTLVDCADPGCHSDSNATNPASCVPADDNEVNGASCGNGVLEGGEECDDGNTAAGDGCSSTCRITTQCNDGVDNSDPEDTLIDCADPGCHTDGNAANPGSCNPADTSEINAPSCGNGVVDGAESCDDGNTSQNDACLNACTLNICGDGHAQRSFPVAEPGDPCDDGNTVSGDGCSSTCVTEQLYNCEGLNPDICTIPMMGGGGGGSSTSAGSSSTP